MFRENCPLEDDVFICETGRSIRMSVKPVLKLSSLISSKWITFFFVCMKYYEKFVTFADKPEIVYHIQSCFEKRN